MIAEASPFTDTSHYTAAGLYGYAGQGPTYGIASPIQQMASDELDQGWWALVDPHNPLVWFGALLLVTVGAAGVAGSIKLGPAKLSASIGKS